MTKWWTPYGGERWKAGEIPSSVCSHFHAVCKPPKPFLTAYDLTLLREMKIGLVPNDTIDWL